MKKINLIYKKFGKLFVVEDTGQRSGGMIIWKCNCDCGKIKNVRSDHLRNNTITHCGCSNGNKVHGYGNSYNPTYKVWQHMKDRCLNHKNIQYKDYGGRGIQVCDRWKNSFENFLEDMGEKPDGLSIDRIDNDGNYELSNCKWSTFVEQNRNKRNNKLNAEQIKEIRELIYEQNISYIDIANIYNVSECTIYDIKSGRTWKN